MADPQGLASFPGVQGVVGCTMNFCRGISPSVAMLSIAPQDGMIAISGDLEFTFDDVTVTFRDCKVDRNSLRWDRRGQVWELAIFDRRWKWSMGAISGHYNLRNDDGSIKDGTAKTPQQLAQFCLDAIGEQGADVGDLPVNPRPEVTWDHEVPMEALARLCQSLGCIVVLQLDDKVAIRQAGQGAELPEDGVLENSLTIDLPEKPSALGIVCGPDVFQHDFSLEAVGQEADGTVKPINSLSYTPSGGWAIAFKESPDLTAVYDQFGENDHNLAQQTIYRWYRVIVPFWLPGFGNVWSLDQVLPLRNERVEVVWQNGVKKNRPPIVYGVFYANSDVPPYSNTQAVITAPVADDGPNVYRKPFSLDVSRGLVIFSEPVFANASSSGDISPAAATLNLRASCNARDSTTFSLSRYERERVIGQPGNTPTKFYRHDELAVTYIDGLPVNQATIDAGCDHYLDGAEKEFEVTTPQSIVYPGLRKIELDGAIAQLMLSVGRQGATTRAARNDEAILWTRPFRERRWMESLREIVRNPGYVAGVSLGRLSNRIVRWWTGK